MLLLQVTKTPTQLSVTARNETHGGLDIPGSRRVTGGQWWTLSRDQFLRGGHWLKGFRKRLQIPRKVANS